MSRDIRRMAMEIPEADRPIAKSKLSGIGNFFGLYGGEHIAATEFIIGSTMVMWGVKASDIFIGLIVGNILAVLTYTLLCAPIAVDTHLSLYAYLKKIAGPYMQKFYNVLWIIATCLMAAPMINVSASAIREIFGVEPQLQWYPTSLKFVLIVCAIGAVVTLVAANGFNAVAKFSSTCVPWMVVVFFAGAVVALPQLIEVTGFSQVTSFSEFIGLANTHIWNGVPVEGGEKLGILHVIAFAWMCNLSYHGGLNDMALFRNAKSYKYGYISAIGMFIGHFFAWASAGIMGASAAIIVGTSIRYIDPGSVTNTILGGMGLCAVIVAGWTTVNPMLYRGSLCLQTLFEKANIKKLTYILGAIITFASCFPGTSDAAMINSTIALIVPPIGAIIVAEHFIFPKIGLTRYWTKYRGDKINRPALFAWITGIVFVALMKVAGLIHQYYLWLPTYILTGGAYILYASFMGAKEDYSKEVKLEEAVQAELKNIVEEDALKEVATSKNKEKVMISKVLNIVAYIILAVIVVMSIMMFKNNMEINQYKSYAFIATISYFVISGISVYLQNRRIGKTSKLTAGDNEVVLNVER